MPSDRWSELEAAVRTFILVQNIGPVPLTGRSHSRPDGGRIASGSYDHSIKLWDAASGALLATLFAYDGKGLAYTPDGLFFGDADPRAALAIVRGKTNLPMDDFAALNRRDSLADALAPKPAAAK
jgi:hypothetical protein